MQKLKTFALLTGGTLITVTGIYFFKFPNNFSTGGVSGISLILSSLFPSISAGTFVWIINILLLILGLIIVGRDFTVKTVYCSLLMSFSLRLLEIILPLNAPLTNQPFLELCFAVLLPAIGSAILFNCAGRDRHNRHDTQKIHLIKHRASSFNSRHRRYVQRVFRFWYNSRHVLRSRSRSQNRGCR